MAEIISLSKAYEQQFNAGFNALDLNSRVIMSKYQKNEKLSEEQKLWCAQWIHEITLKAEHFFDHQNDPIPVSKIELKDDEIRR